MRRFAAAATVAAALVLPAGAAAQIDPGVNYDPGSPAGKEYAIPLVLGRAEGAGTEDQQAAANTPFGVGVTPPGSGGSGKGGGGEGAGRSDPTDGGGNPDGAGTVGATAEITAEQRARIVRAEDPGGAGTWTLGVGLAVLLCAAAFTLVLRRGPAHRPA